MSDQNPYGAPPPPHQPYGAQPPHPGYGQQPQPPAYGYPQQQPAPPPYGAQPGGYGVPQQQAWGGGVTPQPPQKPKQGLWIALGCVGGAILIGGGLLGYYVYGETSKPSSSPTGSTTRTKYTIALPAKFQGLPQENSNPLAKQLESGLDSSLGSSSTTPVSTVYTDQQKVVAVFGGYGTVIGPNTQLDAFFESFEKGAGSKGTTFSGRKDFDAGPLGGRLSCEVMHAPAEDDSLCAWADGSTLVGVLTGEVQATEDVDLDKAAAAARELRTLSEIPK